MAAVNDSQGQFVFGLDIGTRSIVGTVGYRKGEHFCVVAQRAKEHDTRAMLDGQIHDITKVGETIRQVKQQLEAEIGKHLTEVCIAAAGRVLRTVTISVEQELEAEKEIVPEDIYSLDTMGVEKAYEEFSKVNDTEMKFYCVGYTSMRYYLNGYQIGNLEGHKAKRIGLDLIATFLPDDVVDGLYKAVELAGLQVANLTLEPIAAIQVAIPEKFRMLNMALVDVGAGTSDISVTKDGTIIAYGMIPVAGDSLTNILVQHCLVDFDTAEQIKKQTGKKEVIEYEDIMGLVQTITSQEVLELLDNAVTSMTKQVSDCILELNGDKPVSAVFVVGGGGMIPGYTQKLAEELGIVKERVAIRGEEVMKGIEFENSDALKDSLMVTPIGICLSYYEQSNNFIFVVFNDVRVKLYDNGKLVVADAAMQALFPNESLFPKRGKALTFTVNGKGRMVRGTQGEAAVIQINGEEADISTKIHNGDRITVIPSTAGADAVMELRKLPELSECLQVMVNGVKIELPKTASVNGSLKNEFYQIQDGDDIQVSNCYTIEQIAAFMDVVVAEESTILVNDTPAKRNTKVYENFTVEWEIEETAARQENENIYREIEETVGESQEEIGNKIENTIRDEVENQIGNEVKNKAENKVENKIEQKDITSQGNIQDIDDIDIIETTPKIGIEIGKEGKSIETKQVIEMVVLVNRQPITLTGKSSYIFVDIFDVIHFDLNQSNGRSIVTKLNGRAAQYMEQLHAGDVIEVYWDDTNRF